MNEQPAKAAELAEIARRFWVGLRRSEDLITALNAAYASRDEQLAALTDKLAAVTAEREEAMRRILGESQYVESLRCELSAHAATIEGLKRANEIEKAAYIEARTNHWKRREAAENEAAALRTRVAELEGEKLSEVEERQQYAVRVLDLESELAQVRRDKEEEAESYAAVIRINGSQHETIRDGLYRKLDELRAEVEKELRGKDEAITALDNLLNTSAVITPPGANYKDDFVDLQVRGDYYEAAYDLLKKENK